MKIIGIDVGLAITGYGIIEKNNNSIKYIDHGVIETSKFDTTSRRLVILHEKLSELIKTEKPDLVGVEQLFFFRNVTTIITVGQARGVIMLTLEEELMNVIEVTPLQVKQFISSYGRANKKQVQEMVKRLLNLDKIPKPDDAADALAIAICSSYLKNFNL